MKFRKKPIIIEAIQWTEGVTIEEIEKDLPGIRLLRAVNMDALLVQTLEGEMTANYDDWIIRGIKGEFYPCKPDIFEATYERVEG